MKRLMIALAVLAVAVGALFAPLPFEDETRIVTSTAIDRSPAQVYAYVTTPGNWPKWHPSSLGVSGETDHPLALGEAATEDFVVAGHRGRAKWTVTLRETPSRWRIEAEVDGRKAGVITYTLTEEGTSSRFVREFVYRSPNLLFALLNRLSIRAQVEAESAEALRRLKRVMEAAPRISEIGARSRARHASTELHADRARGGGERRARVEVLTQQPFAFGV
jgi:uncharacterized protein YndB with AHSA1/START domain